MIKFFSLLVILLIGCATAMGDPTGMNVGSFDCLHNNGLGQTYRDCDHRPGTPGDDGAYTELMAKKAAWSWVDTYIIDGQGASGDVQSIQCGSTQDTIYISLLLSTGQVYVSSWTFHGPLSGRVSRMTTQKCPGSTEPTWN